MIGIKIQGRWLDLFPATVLNFELNSPIYLGDEVDVIQGAFSFPASLPLTANNRAVLGFPDRLDNARPFVKDIDAEIWAEGLMLFPALATVTEASPGKGKITLLVGWISKFKETKLNELDLGGTVTMGSNLATTLLHAKNTALNPLDGNHVFFPVHNPGFLDDSDSDTAAFPGDFQNYWDTTAQQFLHRPNDVATPFLRLDFVLEKLFAHGGFSLKNSFQTSDELRLMTLYNNFNITNLATGDWANSFNPQNHVSKSKSSDFLKNVARLFNLGVFVNYFDKTAEIVPLERLLARLSKHDWTKKAFIDHTVSQRNNYPTWFTYPSIYKELAYYGVEQEFLEKGLPPFYAGHPLKVVDKMENLTNADPVGYYVETTSNHIFEFVSASPENWSERGSYMPAIFEKTDFRFTAGIGSAWMGDELNRVPQVKVKGTTATETNECPDRLLFYRGMQKDWQNKNYPMGDTMGFTANKNVIQMNSSPVQYSLYWDGEKGIYNRFWKNWHTLLKRKKDVNRKIALTVRDLRNFSFADKVRIENQDYFVKKMQVSLSSRGLEPVTADLVSII